MAAEPPAQPVRTATTKDRPRASRAALAALALAMVAVILGAYSVAAILEQGPPPAPGRSSPSSSTVYSNTITASSGTPYVGYVGYDNFSTPGARGDLAELSITATLNGSCMDGVVCSIALGSSGFGTIGAADVEDLNASSGSTVEFTLIVLAGPTEIEIDDFPTIQGNAPAAPLKLATTIVDEGLVALQ
jgi:hypothetical protein